MRNALLIITLLFSLFSFGQKEGQNFCKGDYPNGFYFELAVLKKKIYWFDTYYFEERIGTKEINGKNYFEYKQTWKDGSSDLLYLRYDGDKVLQFVDGFKEETIRYDAHYKIGDAWENVQKEGVYTIKSFEGKLLTPYCNYEGLLIIEAKYETVTYNYYYLRGLGYVGATKNNALISYITPEM